MSVYEIFLPASLRLPLRLCVGAYGVFIVWASLRPAGTGGAIPHLDKLFHLLVYAVLSGAIILAWPRLSKLRVFWACIVFGGVMELAQGSMDVGRSASLLDGVANSLGAALGVYIASYIRVKFAK